MGKPDKKSGKYEKNMDCTTVRNLVAFWLFGLCNNFDYSVMLGAAQDILERDSEISANSSDICQEEITSRQCRSASTGVVLFVETMPALLMKIFTFVLVQQLPYGIRHFLTCAAQGAAFVVTARANAVGTALLGVTLSSISSGLGDMTYLGLASHYPRTTISTWSSGTGMAGILGTFSYAALTDEKFVGFTPTEVILMMFIVPIVFLFTYYYILVPAPTIPAVSLFRPSSWFLQPAQSLALGSSTSKKKPGNMKEKNRKRPNPTVRDQIMAIKSLLKYMIPYGTVYFMQYVILQGLIEMVIFDCSHSFDTSTVSQYRWYQVFYHVGVFVARSSVTFLKLDMFFIYLTALIQALLAGLIFSTAVYAFIPHFAAVCALMFLVGVIGGCNYATTYYQIHKKVDPAIREFALSTVTFADTFGILAAAIVAIPVHRWVCAMHWFA
ncbi:hypothetical protein Q1695_005792 [Nippostrongylus brasiliensis]|nr:hypothetical protein Q1695_005792 [Nippostrongylus brasiliensis]